MYRFEFYLLRKFIRHLLHMRCSQKLFDIIWEEAKKCYWEDNPGERYYHFKEKLSVSYQTELREIEQKFRKR